MTRSDQIKQWVEGVTYRPGWSVKFAETLSDGRLYIVVHATEPNVCNPSAKFRTSPLFQVPDTIQTRADFLDWLLDHCIPGIEQHERYEWFRIDGEKWRDPHAKNMPAFATNFEAETYSMPPELPTPPETRHMTVENVGTDSEGMLTIFGRWNDTGEPAVVPVVDDRTETAG